MLSGGASSGPTRQTQPNSLFGFDEPVFRWHRVSQRARPWSRLLLRAAQPNQLELELGVAPLEPFESAVERLDGCERNTVGVDLQDGPVARADTEAFHEVLGHRTDVARLSGLGLVDPGRDGQARQLTEHLIGVHRRELALHVSVADRANVTAVLFAGRNRHARTTLEPTATGLAAGATSALGAASPRALELAGAFDTAHLRALRAVRTLGACPDTRAIVVEHTAVVFTDGQVVLALLLVIAVHDDGWTRSARRAQIARVTTRLALAGIGVGAGVHAAHARAVLAAAVRTRRRTVRANLTRCADLRAILIALASGSAARGKRADTLAGKALHGGAREATVAALLTWRAGLRTVARAFTLSGAASTGVATCFRSAARCGATGLAATAAGAASVAVADFGEATTTGAEQQRDQRSTRNDSFHRRFSLKQSGSVAYVSRRCAPIPGTR